MNSQPTVFFVEDDEAFRYTVQRQLQAAGLPVETFDSAEAFLEGYEADRPGCLVVDLALPGMSGLELQERLQAMECMLPVIVLSGHATIPAAVAAVQRGALDFLEKPVNEAVLLEKVRQALNHGRERHERQARRVRYQCRLARLTGREREVLELVVSGRTNKEVAAQLHISTKTVEAHRSKIMLKTEADNLVELLRIADAGEAAPRLAQFAQAVAQPV